MTEKLKFSAVDICFLGSVLLLSVIPAYATFPGKNGHIAFIQNGEIFTMNPNGTGTHQLTHLGPGRAANWESWSANGKQIVFNEGPAPPDGDGTGELWLMNADGSDQHLLLAEPDFTEQRPSFSPDGLAVVFGRCDQRIGDGDTCAIYSIGVDGSGLRAITEFHEDTTARNPMYSPDGRTIAFILSNDTVAGFLGVTYLIDSDGANIRRITEPEPCLIRPDWSPDGAKITTFAHFCQPLNETVAVMSPDGTGLRYLTHNGSDYLNGPHDRNPAFSPDGNFIVFERVSPDLSTSAIYVMKADGKEPKRIAAFRTKGERSRRAGRKLRVKRIEDGGSIPRWGVATQ